MIRQNQLSASETNFINVSSGSGLDLENTTSGGYPVTGEATAAYPNHDERQRVAPSQASAIRGMQRGADIVICSILLLLLLPLVGIIAVLIMRDSSGPVLFQQRRVGRLGEEFWFYKFRSMVSDAEAQRHLLEKHNERTGPVFKMRHDPRITRVGHFLRKFSLDELPQLINVLKGDMSLVGPRPALPQETRVYTPRERQRLACLPGVTGLWQVSGRASLSFEQSIELDLHYVTHQSLGLYFYILLRTIPAVLKAEGAY